MITSILGALSNYQLELLFTLLGTTTILLWTTDCKQMSLWDSQVYGIQTPDKFTVRLKMSH